MRASILYPLYSRDTSPKSALNSRRFDVDGVSYRVKERVRESFSFKEMTWRARIGDAVNYVDASGENVSLPSSGRRMMNFIDALHCTPRDLPASR